MTAEEWEWLKEFFGHRCAWCEEPCADLTEDHIIPLVDGGTHELRNVVPSCRPCNSWKKAISLP